MLAALAIAALALTFVVVSGGDGSAASQAAVGPGMAVEQAAAEPQFDAQRVALAESAGVVPDVTVVYLVDSREAATALTRELNDGNQNLGSLSRPALVYEVKLVGSADEAAAYAALHEEGNAQRLQFGLPSIDLIDLR